MFPIALDPARLSLLLVGEGEAALKRLRQFDEAGAQRLTVFAAEPHEALIALAGERLIRRWPTAGEVGEASAIFVAGVEPARAETIAAWARAFGRLVNVEDVPALCDFHVPAVVRRGDLLLSVSTGGTNPGLARRVKEFLAERFGEEWGGFTAELAEKRRAWRAEGASPKDVLARATLYIEQKGWLGAGRDEEPRP